MARRQTVNRPVTYTSLVYSVPSQYYAAWLGVRRDVFIRRVAVLNQAGAQQRLPRSRGMLKSSDATAAAAAVVSRPCV